MIPTFANFAWDIETADNDSPPFAARIVEGFAATIKAAGLKISRVQDQAYAWGFDCSLPHLVMECQLGLVGGQPETWLLACRPRRSLGDWWRGTWREDEQEAFVNSVDAVLRADVRVKGLRWYTEKEWDQPGRLAR